MLVNNEDEDKIKRALCRIKPRHVIISCLMYLIICMIAIVLFDIYNLAGVRSFLEASDLEKPRVWFHIFNEQGPTEMLQWLLLSLTTLISVFISGRLMEKRNYRLGYFWYLIGILTIILLLEDGSNVSHKFQEYMSYIAPESIFDSRFIVYSIYMIIAIVPLIKYGKDLYYYRTSFTYLITGYFVYGFAGFISVFLGLLGISRAPVGNYIIYNLLNGKLLYPYPRFHDAMIGEIFMDTVVEESIELFATCLLLCSILSFVHEHYNDQINGNRMN